MLLIVLSHTKAPSLYYSFYKYVFLSAFFMACGYTFNPRGSFAQFFKHKLCTQVWPFITLGLINSALSIFVEHDSVVERLQFIISRNGVWDDLWFIACLISTEFIFYAVTALTGCAIKANSGKLYLTFTLLLLVTVTAIGLLYVRFIGIPLPWQFEGACISVVFVAVGYCYRRVEEKLEAKFTGKRVLLYVGITAIYLLSAGLIKNSVSVHGEEYQSFTLYFILAILGTTSLVMACKWIEKHRDTNKAGSIIVKILIFVGQNTLIYYAFQSKFIKVSYMVMDKMGVELSEYMASILVAVIVYLVLLIPAWIIKKWFPWILRFPVKKRG